MLAVTSINSAFTLSTSPRSTRSRGHRGVGQWCTTKLFQSRKQHKTPPSPCPSFRCLQGEHHHRDAVRHTPVSRPRATQHHRPLLAQLRTTTSSLCEHYNNGGGRLLPGIPKGRLSAGIQATGRVTWKFRVPRSGLSAARIQRGSQMSQVARQTYTSSPHDPPSSRLGHIGTSYLQEAHPSPGHFRAPFQILSSSCASLLLLSSMYSGQNSKRRSPTTRAGRSSEVLRTIHMDLAPRSNVKPS